MKTIFQKCYIITIISFLLITCYSCNLCKDCPNKLDKYLGSFFPYYDGEIIEFINTDSIFKRDTVIIEYNSPDGEYDCWLGKESTYECYGYYALWIGDFKLKITQEAVIDNMEINQTAKFGREYFEFIDTVDYYFNNTKIKARYYQRRDTSFLEKDYFDFYLSLDNKLLEYKIREGQNIETWYLKE